MLVGTAIQVKVIYMNKAARKKELLDTFDGVDDVKNVVLPMIDDVIFLEDKLETLRTKLAGQELVHGDKTNPGVRVYKELLQQYNNCIKILASVLRKDVPEEESPLRAFVNSRAKHD